MDLNKILSKWVINSNIQSKPSRPYPYSTYSETPPPGEFINKKGRCFFMPDLKNPTAWKVNDYTSWESLKDKSYNNRLLPVAKVESQKTLPPINKVIDAFVRNGRPMQPCHRTSLLFMGFAQWFTDAFFRIDFNDIRKNTSNHEIDLCQLYGLNKTTTNALRSKQGGRLLSQIINNKEFPPYLFDENLKVVDRFKNIEYISYLSRTYREFWNDNDKKRKFYATGLGRGNSTVSHSTINTLFLRFHNKIAGLLETKYAWSDERLFQTTRNILIVILIKIVIEDYVNHLKPFKWMSFEFDTTYAPNKKWYRNNWISTEFNLLYRWHSMIPDNIILNGEIKETKDVFRFNNQFVEDNSIRSILEQLSYQKAGKMTLMNTPDFMKEAEMMTLFISRASKLTSYADYCEEFSGSMSKYFNTRPQKMSDITKDKDQLSILNKLYDGDVEKVDLVIGALAQDPPKNPLYEDTPILGNLMLQMIASDAFSHALTNPLLSENVFNEKTFSPLGWKLIQQFKSVKSIVDFTEETNSAVSFNYNKVTQKL